MYPTKEEIDQRIEEIERDQMLYRALGKHNRLIARERIDDYRERRMLDEVEEESWAS